MPGNWLEWNDQLFPSGPEKLVARPRHSGLKLGLWIGPFWLSPEPDGRVEPMKDACCNPRASR